MPGSVAWTSPDGLAWTRAESPSLALGRAVALAIAADRSIVAVGSDLDEGEALAWRSADGRSWQVAPREASRYLGGRKVRMTDVTRVDDRLVAVGNHVGLQFGTASSWTSMDGVRWSRSVDSPAMEQGELSAVAPGGPGLVAVGTFGAPDNYIPRVWREPWIPLIAAGAELPAGAHRSARLVRRRTTSEIRPQSASVAAREVKATPSDTPSQAQSERVPAAAHRGGPTG